MKLNSGPLNIKPCSKKFQSIKDAVLKARLLLVVMFLGVACLAASAQHATSFYSGTIVGPTAAPIVGATVQLQIADHTLLLVTGERVISGLDKIVRAGHTDSQDSRICSATERLLPSQPRTITLSLATNSERVVVTADRTALALNRVRRYGSSGFAAGITADRNLTFGDQLRQVTGLQFYRRSSTLVGESNFQGVSLRGLGSTAASRTLVLAGHVPMNDPFGGWVYWDQLPSLAIQNVEVVRGGASDLYGNSAIGGVINMIEHQPDPLPTPSTQATARKIRLMLPC